ncbi:hypothetical protein [Microbulbifer sp. TYP-18]|uniref:hypothetical protein n=1 Tax=Microbulbifer sp. TYP-18 TaxID=3230024 RepID=UPI0034C640CC
MLARTLALLVSLFSFSLSAVAASHNPGRDSWHQIDSANFRVVTNGDAARVRVLVQDLERYRTVALQLLGANGDGQKLTIYATADRDSYASLVGDELADVTNGLFDTTAQGSYALVNLESDEGGSQQRAREFLFHEYTHFLSYHRNTTYYPYWYSEGFAEFMSTMTFPAPGRYQLGAVPSERAATLYYMAPMPLERLLTATIYNTSNDDKARLYASGWMLAHWLIMESGKTEEFKDYVRGYNRGADPVKTLETALGVKLADVKQRYKQLFEHGNFAMVTGDIPAGFREAQPQVQLLSQQSAVTEIAGFLVMSGYNVGGLDDLLHYAHKKGIYSHQLTAVQADAETRLGNFDQAQRLLETIPPQQRKQFWYQGVDAWLELTRQIHTPEKSRDRESLKRARDEFVYLVNNDSDNASHWYGLALAMDMLGYPRDKYVEMLEQAYFRAPRQIYIAEWLARELYEKKDAEYFTTVAQPLLLELKDEESHRQIKAMLAEMRAQQGHRQEAKASARLVHKQVKSTGS